MIFLKTIPLKDLAKVLREIDLLQEFGLNLGLPHIKKLVNAEDLWELRIKFSSNHYRIFYFVLRDQKFVLLHAFQKNQMKRHAVKLILPFREKMNLSKEVNNMDHKTVKSLLLSNPELKAEYDALEPIYDITREVIRLRIEKGLTQKELAELVGTKQSAISRLENGSYNPSIEFLSKIAHALGKEVKITFL